MARQPTAATAAAAMTPVPAHDALVGLVGALAWPIVALLIAAVFRQPLSTFLATVGSRITKLSLFKVELELVPAAGAAAQPALLDDIKGATSGGALGDSSRMMLDQLELSTPADFTLIHLGAGAEWLTTRLYLAAILMQRMRGVGAFVFLERKDGSELHFVAVVPPSTLRWALARQAPQLESAWLWARAMPPANVMDARINGYHPPIRSDAGALDPQQARQYARNFIDAVQRPVPTAPAPVAGSPIVGVSSPGISSPGVSAPGIPAPGSFTPPPAEEGWVRLGTQDERAQWVDRIFLEAILPPPAFDAWTGALRDGSPAARARAVLRRQGDFVALVDDAHRFQRLVNRRALLEGAAASLAQEPDGK